jgi:UDP-glucose 4-epimerase
VRVLVTGASGLIGSRLVARLAERGDEVHALVREPATAPREAYWVVAHDLREPLGPETIPAVDAIVHLAHHPHVAVPEHATALYRLNTMSTQELLEAARRVGARRFVYASSGAVYGFSDAPLRETEPPRARDLYALTKLHAEELVRAYGEFFEPVVVRPFFPYGPGQTGRLVSGLIERVRGGEPVTLREGGRPRCNPIYVDDAVRAFVAALDGPAPNLVNVAGGEVVSIAELAEAIGRVVGREPVFAEDASPAEGDLVADVTRMRELLGPGELAALDEGLRRAVAGSPL